MALENENNYSAIRPVQSSIVNERIHQDVVIKERLGGGNFSINSDQNHFSFFS
jgi:hypothetical protein